MLSGNDMNSELEPELSEDFSTNDLMFLKFYVQDSYLVTIANHFTLKTCITIS